MRPHVKTRSRRVSVSTSSNNVAFTKLHALQYDSERSCPTIWSRLKTCGGRRIWEHFRHNYRIYLDHDFIQSGIARTALTNLAFLFAVCHGDGMKH